MANNSIAYGFMDLKAMFANRVSTIDTTVTDTALLQSAEEYTRQTDEVLSLFVTKTTDRTRRYLIPGSGTLQPIDEHGNPMPVIPGGYYDTAFPIQGGATAYGDNRVTRAMMTIGDLNGFMLDAQVRDSDWMIRHILAGIFDNTTWTFVDPQGTLTIQPLANGDTVLYPRTGGTAPATATHYLAQAAAIADATKPFTTMYTTLTRYPSQSNSDVVAFVPTANVAAITGLASFVPVGDPRVQPAAAAAQLRTDGASFIGPGSQVLGLVDRVWIVEWARLPTDYLIAVAVDADPVLGMREYPVPELQGLFREQYSPDGNHAEDRFIRYAGFGVQNRLGAVVQRVGNGAYAIPTGFSTPLPV